MFAGIIGACGILTNSQILIVGAMVVGPEYNAIVAIALGIDRHDRRAIGRGLLVLLVGFGLAIAVTLLFALCIRWLGREPRLYRLGLRPVSDLINSPNLFSVVVAVVAGLVGVISLTEAKAGALIGVFISITTIPAAADVGVSTAFGAWGEAGGSAGQLVLNVGLLIAVGALGLRLQRLIWRRWAERRSPIPWGRVNAVARAGRRWCAVRHRRNAIRDVRRRGRADEHDGVSSLRRGPGRLGYGLKLAIRVDQEQDAVPAGDLPSAGCATIRAPSRCRLASLALVRPART